MTIRYYRLPHSRYHRQEWHVAVFEEIDAYINWYDLADDPDDDDPWRPSESAREGGIREWLWRMDAIEVYVGPDELKVEDGL